MKRKKIVYVSFSFILVHWIREYQLRKFRSEKNGLIITTRR